MLRLRSASLLLFSALIAFGQTAFQANGGKKPYVIGPEDVLRLNVLHQWDQELVVRQDGFVTIRFAGEVKAVGLTTIQLAQTVTDKLTTYFKHPEVNVQVLKIRSQKIKISDAAFYDSNDVMSGFVFGLFSAHSAPCFEMGEFCIIL